MLQNFFLPAHPLGNDNRVTLPISAPACAESHHDTDRSRLRRVICSLESRMSERSDKPIVFAGPMIEEPPKSESPERRAQPRFPFTAAADVYELRSQTRVNGRCSDLSLGGCYVDTLSPFPVGAVVRIRMERDTR